MLASISKTDINWQVFIFAFVNVWIKCLCKVVTLPMWPNKMSLWRCKECMTVTFLKIRNHPLALFINSRSHSCSVAFPNYGWYIFFLICESSFCLFRFFVPSKFIPFLDFYHQILSRLLLNALLWSKQILVSITFLLSYKNLCCVCTPKPSFQRISFIKFKCIL